MTGSIGPYRIIEELGAGAMGVVYVAEDTRLHRRVPSRHSPESGVGHPTRAGG